MRALLTILLLTASASAQSFNVDLGGPGVPGPDYRGAAAVGLVGPWWEEAPLPGAGPWNAVPLTGATGLIATNGLATGVSMSSTATSTFVSSSSALAGDDRELMLDGEVAQPGITTTYTFSGLSAGSYTVYTYAWNPDDPSARTRVSAQGSVDPAFEVGAPWSGSPHAILVTYAYQDAQVYAGGTIRISVEGVGGLGSVNGFQIRGSPSGVNFCWADGSGTACPCGNATLPPRGCAHSGGATGAEISTGGIARVSYDTLRLTATRLPAGANALFFQGTSRIAGGFGALYGDGLRCVGGTSVRLGIHTATPSGGATHPEGVSGVAVSIAGSVAPGDVRHYQVVYRDPNPGFCTASTFNATNGVTVLWQM